MSSIKLGDAATYINGFAFKPEDRGTEGLPIIRIQDLTGNAYDLGFYDGEYPDRIEINDGDVLISWSASLGVYIWNRGKALLNQHIFKVVFDKSPINKEFFVYAIQHKLREMEMKTHGATMKHIIKKDFENTLIPYPSEDVQQNIVCRLNSVANILKNRREELCHLDTLIKARFVEMFGDPVSNPFGLPVKKLSELGSLDRGRSQHRPRNDPALLGGPYPLIQTGEVSAAGLYITEYHNTYSEMGLKQSKMWQAGTLCITIAANIARTAIMTFDACFPDSVVGFVPYGEVSTLYMHYWFGFFQKILEEQAPQVAQKNINLKILSNLNVLVPDRKRLKQFEDFVQQVDKSKVVVRRALSETQVLLGSLMQSYFG